MANEVEVIEQIPSGIMVQSANQSVEQTVANAEKYLQSMNQIRKLSIKLLNNGDISDQGGKPYLEKSACDKIASAFGVKIFDVTFERDPETDDKGEYLIYTCNLRGIWNNHEESEIGTCSTRDDFFGKRAGNYKPLSEVDLTDIKKKAFTNGANRIIKKLIGLSFTWQEIAELSDGKISQENVGKVTFGKGSKGGNTDSPETKTKRDEIRAILLKLCDGEEQAAKEMLVKMTTFEGTNGTVAGKNNVQFLTEKQVDNLLPRLKKELEKVG
jgi:hypothetical protein